MKIATFSLLFIVCTAVFNIFEKFEHWNWESFLLGMVCGLPILTCNLMSKKVSFLLFLVGASGLSLTAFGAANGLIIDHEFFSGMSIGVILGVFPALVLVRRETLLFLIKTANLDGYHRLAFWIENRFLVKP